MKGNTDTTSLSELTGTIPEDDTLLLAQHPNGLVRAFRDDVSRDWLESEGYIVKASGVRDKDFARDVIYSYYNLWCKIEKGSRDDSQ